MLPTPPHGDAVSVGYKPESVYLKRTYTFLTKHTYKRTTTGSANQCERSELEALVHIADVSQMTSKSLRSPRFKEPVTPCAFLRKYGVVFDERYVWD